ncbi:MAG TPA: NAD(P)H-dependent oxidoreductase subunit E [Actinophytocola sp.]|jgi:formate dehydrogenase subunit gamma|nr:NAD(P)H-dependent oxidoreductase subunit E [Actinophytocola sp.]
MSSGPTAGGSPVELRVRSAVAAHRGDRGALLPILHDIQAEFGYVDKAVVPIIADELNLSRADVYGVISFYHDFREQPAAGTVVRVCRAEACQANGAAALFEHAEQVSGVTVEQVFCFGNCALGPAVEINGRLVGRVDANRLDALLAEANPQDRAVR